MVDVSNKQNNAVIKVTVSNGNTNITATADTAQYWSKQSRLSAENSKESAQEAKEYAELANSYIDGFENVVTNNTNNIITISNDYINELTGLKETGVEEINEAVTSGKDEINTTKTTAITEINSTKTTAVNAVNTSKNQALDDIEKESSSIINFKEEVNAELENKVDVDDMVAFDMKEVPCITETYVNGTSGYIVYSNGYCEQWGYLSAGKEVTVNLLKAYANTDYNMLTTPRDSGATTNYRASLTEPTLTSFRYVCTASVGAYWRTTGYIA